MKSIEIRRSVEEVAKIMERKRRWRRMAYQAWAGMVKNGSQGGNVALVVAEALGLEGSLRVCAEAGLPLAETGKDEVK